MVFDSEAPAKWHIANDTQTHLIDSIYGYVHLSSRHTHYTWSLIERDFLERKSTRERDPDKWNTNAVSVNSAGHIVLIAASIPISCQSELVIWHCPCCVCVGVRLCELASMCTCKRPTSKVTRFIAQGRWLGFLVDAMITASIAVALNAVNGVSYSPWFQLITISRSTIISLAIA